MSSEKAMKKYRVWLRSVPGFYAQYNGKVDVWSEDEEQAVISAFHRLKQTSFPDRNSSMWKIEKIECIGVGSE
jgi:hypothetical protein